PDALKSLILAYKDTPSCGHVRSSGRSAPAENLDGPAAQRSIGSVNPLVHYLEIGGYEGRNPHPEFDTAYYLENYPDATSTDMTPLEHFLEIGAAKGYKPSPNFDLVLAVRDKRDER